MYSAMDAEHSNEPSDNSGDERTPDLARKRLKFSQERTDLRSQDLADDLECEYLDKGDGTDNDSEVELNSKNANNNAIATGMKRKKKVTKTPTGVDANQPTVNKPEKPPTVGYVMPEQSTGSTDEVETQNKRFESFMVWMDRYKQFEEWEKSRHESHGESTNVVLVQSKDKAIQSPSDSTIYSRMCESIGSKEFEPIELTNKPGVAKKCSSTATTVDDYAGMSESEIDQLILEARRAAINSQPMVPEQQQNEPVRDLVVNDQSSDDETEEQRRKFMAEAQSKERRDKILLDAELQRAELLKPGKFGLRHLFYDAQHRSLGSHLDRATITKIVRGEFVEFHRLIPKKKFKKFRDRGKNSWFLTTNGGPPQFVEEEDDNYISSYAKWEEAFDIFASIYLRGHPQSADELYDYKHVIRGAAADYIWENVFDYDVEFRLHMEKHPTRGWSAKLTDEWTRHMKNLKGAKGDTPSQSSFAPTNDQGGQTQKREICIRYNKGRCTWGSKCRNIHKCSVCGKRGHGASICFSNKNRRKEDVGSRSSHSNESTHSKHSSK